MSTNILSLGVHIKVKNFDASKRFYQALGFQQVFAYGPDQKIKEDYSGAVFAHGGAKLEIASGHRAVKPQVFQESISSSKVSLMIQVKSLSNIINRCRKAKILITVSPRHYYWGTLELVVKDPDGLVLVFIAPYTPAAAHRLHADETWSSPPRKC